MKLLTHLFDKKGRGDDGFESVDSEKVYCRPFKQEKKWPFEITLQTIIFKFLFELIFFIYIYIIMMYSIKNNFLKIKKNIILKYL